ncbi:hypothetical protein ACTVFP_22430, partial [Escherichia coli]|uniref:hypothetical protein n=1 Tax=Escherichia coli TaxID=562 RepID=UPI003FA530FB
MLTNLSFKTKLLLLLITAVLGFIIVTFVAIGGLASQQKANDELRTLSKIQTSNDQLSIQMLEMADSLRSVSVDNYNEFIANAKNQIEQNAIVEQSNIEKASNQELKGILAENLKEINNYSQALIALTDKHAIVGFNSSSGLRGDVDKMGADISNDIKKLSLLRREFTNVRKAESDYLADPTSDNLDAFMTSFGRFDNRIINFGFQ